MAAGDEFGLSEDLYNVMIGRYVSTIEVLVRRGNLKDQKIAELEAKLAEVTANALANTPKDGEVKFGDADLG